MTNSIPLNLSQYIQKFENACSTTLLKAINDIMYKEEMIDAETIGGVNLKHRNAKLLALNDYTIGTSVAKRIIYNDLVRLIKQTEYLYLQKVNNPWYSAKEVTIEFLKYDSKTKGHFTWHVDAYDAAPRQLTMLLGLNDAYTGGTLKVLNDNISFKLKTNELICFPSNFMFPHTVEPVETGVRKVAIFWTL